MNKTLAILGAFGAASSIFLLPVGSPNVALPQQIKSAGSALLDNVLADLSVNQARYFQENGMYWQGLSSEVPGAKPSDVSEDWSTMAQIPVGSRFSFRTDVYQSPKGKGYFVTIQTVEKGRLYEKVVNFGAETGFEHDWVYVPPL